MFVVKERCSCNAAISIETADKDGSQIFAADFVNAWRDTHKHDLGQPVIPEGEAHISVDALVEQGMGFQRTQGEVHHG